MESFSLNYTLKDLKKLDREQLFEKTKTLYYENVKLANKIYDLEDTIAKFEKKQEKKKSKENDSANYDGYNNDWVMAEKIVFVLKKNKRPMTSLQIIEQLLILDPKLNEIYNDKIKSMSNFIYNALRLGFIIRSHKAIGGGYNYCVNAKQKFYLNDFFNIEIFCKLYYKKNIMSKQQKKNDQKSVVKNPNNYQHDLDKQNTEKQIKEDKLSKKNDLLADLVLNNPFIFDSDH